MEEENKAVFSEVAKINKANRFFKTAFLFSMGLNIVALGSIVVMFPLKQKEIFVYGIDKNKGGYEIVKLSNASNILNSEAIINIHLILLDIAKHFYFLFYFALIVYLFIFFYDIDFIVVFIIHAHS